MFKVSRLLAKMMLVVPGALPGLAGAAWADDVAPLVSRPVESLAMEAATGAEPGLPAGDVSTATTVPCSPYAGGCGCGGLPCETAAGGSLWEQDKLTGDWLGLRPSLAEQGVTIDLSTTQYYQGVTHGGVEERFRYGGRNDYFVNVDGEKAGLWKGLFVVLHGESRYGESASPLAGTLLPANLALSLPKPNESVTALSGVKVMQFLSEEFMVFGGKINTFDDFKQPLTGAGATNGFMNTALMLNPVLVRTVPYSTYGAGCAVLHELQPVLTFAVFDTNTTSTTSGFDTFFDNGASLVASANLPVELLGLPGHQGVIGTYSTGTYTNLSPSVYLAPGGVVVESTPKQGSWSLGYNFDQAFYVSPSDPRKRWGVFGNLGIADSNPSPIQWMASAGIAGTSPLARRENDTFGAGYFYVGTSEALKDFAPRLLPLQDEQGVELYYNIAVTPWCHITPDIQWLNPFRERVESSSLVGVRAKIDF